MLTVEALIEALSDLPGHHPVFLNVTGSPVGAGSVVQRTDQGGPYVEVLPAPRRADTVR